MNNDLDKQAEYLYSIEYKPLPKSQRNANYKGLSEHGGSQTDRGYYPDHSGSWIDRSSRRSLAKVSPRIDNQSNLEHEPGGGDVTIPTNRLDWSKAQAKVNSKANIDHVPSGGIGNIPQRNLDYRQRAQAKIDSLSNSEHLPGGGNIKIRSRHLAWDAPPTVPTGTSPMKQTPSPTLTLSHPVKYSVGSRIGSLENSDHMPGGGQRVIFDEKPRWKSRAKVGSLENIEHQPGGGGIDILDHPVRYDVKSKIGSLDNADYQPRKPVPRTYDQSDTYTEVPGRVSSLWTSPYKPGGGDVDVQSEARKYLAKARIGALENLHFDPAQGRYLEMAERYKHKTKKQQNDTRRGRQDVIHEHIEYKVTPRIKSFRTNEDKSKSSQHNNSNVKIQTALKDRW